MVNSTAAAVSAVAAMAGSGAGTSGGTVGASGPAGTATATGGADAGGASSGGIKKDEWLGICRVLNTAQYCATITGQLQDKLIEKTVPPFQAQISLARQAEAFKATTMAAVKCLVRTLVDGPATDAAWTAMGRIAWGSLAMAGDRSDYIAHIIRVLQEVVPVVFSGIAEQAMFKSFCDKVAEAVPNKFYGVILKSKPVSEVGAEQLLMDAHVLRDACLKIPAWGDADAAPSSVFTKVLTKGFAKLDSLLKVLLTPGSAPPDALVTAFLSVYAPRDRTRANLAIVLDVRGARRKRRGSGTRLARGAARGRDGRRRGGTRGRGCTRPSTSPPAGGGPRDRMAQLRAAGIQRPMTMAPGANGPGGVEMSPLGPGDKGVAKFLDDVAAMDAALKRVRNDLQHLDQLHRRAFDAMPDHQMAANQREIDQVTEMTKDVLGRIRSDMAGMS
ncbi:hypothetical protein AMAG_19532 [Allomyces macrogynus ATCC 38327]|uniref:Vps53 C-terminal domain-containing protein n=1 Tax=Allomyces macrogynus (strain ATCC 38327) TaxID=578462 RepID=A0A0L0SWF3_ALLM3|nr:hypothetical protein AMAG_19532 [Allomyces macrogynus ATCC 38327]|eukprot:KNE66837.1 hypothetical protein AMAG_19532 [Allomyces macrogynus ATCC 38327]